MAIQIQQRQQEVLQAQQRDAANANAAEMFGNANPLNLDPASLAVTKAQIRNGTYPGMESVVNGLAASANYKDRSAAADLFATSHQGSWDDAHIAAAHARILAGQSDASTEEQNYADAAKATNAATAIIAATKSGQTPEAAEAAAIGQPDTATKLNAGNTLLNQPPITGPLGDPDTQAQLDKTAILRGQAGIPVTAEMPLSSGEAANTAIKDITGKTVVAQAAPRAPEQIIPAVAPVDPLTGMPVGPGSTVPSFQQAAQGPDTAAITQSKSAATAADEGTKFRAADVTADMESGRKANDMLRTVALMRQYANLLDNNAPLGQLSMAFVQRVKDELGVTLDPNQSARNAFEQLGNGLIAETHKDDGVLRVAGPELNFFSRTLPNAQQDRPSLMRALDNLEIKARNLIAVGRKARDVYGATGGNVDAASYTGYTAARDKILAPPTLEQPVGTPDTTPTSDRKKAPPAAGPRVWTKNPDGTMSPPPD